MRNRFLTVGKKSYTYDKGENENDYLVLNWNQKYWCKLMVICTHMNIYKVTYIHIFPSCVHQEGLLLLLLSHFSLVRLCVTP